MKPDVLKYFDPFLQIKAVKKRLNENRKFCKKMKIISEIKKAEEKERMRINKMK